MLGLVYGAAGPARAAKLYPAFEHNTHTQIELINFKLEIDFASFRKVAQLKRITLHYHYNYII